MFSIELIRRFEIRKSRDFFYALHRFTQYWIFVKVELQTYGSFLNWRWSEMQKCEHFALTFFIEANSLAKGSLSEKKRKTSLLGKSLSGKSLSGKRVYNNQSEFSVYFVVLTPLEGGGTIYSNGFFVQTILTDRYIHRTELWVVSINNPSSVEYGNKFFWISYFTGSYRGLKFCE